MGPKARRLGPLSDFVLHSALLIVNPSSGRRRAVRLASAVACALKRRRFEAETALTRDPGEATELARTASAQGCEAVFVMGGDGTLREAASGLLGTTTPLGVLPAGTTNVLARCLRLDRRPLRAVEQYWGGQAELAVRRMDVGLCGGMPFLMMASAGLDAEALAACAPRSKQRWGRAAVVAAAIGRLVSERLSFVIAADGEEWTASFAAVCNIPLYGGPFRMVPEAKWDDGALDLVVLTGHTRLKTLAFAGQMLFERHLRRPDVDLRRISEAVIRGQGVGLVQLDGDVFRLPLPIRIGVAEARLRLLEASPGLTTPV